jgi:hypothetical protein
LFERGGVNRFKDNRVLRFPKEPIDGEKVQIVVVDYQDPDDGDWRRNPFRIAN